MTQTPLVALVGNPNAGKSALFNALTGARQKVGNYPGVTVERKSGVFMLDDGRPVELVDLPGTYSLEPNSPDERVTCDILLGNQQVERAPDAIVIVLDASNLDNHLRFALQLADLGLPAIIALNMMDMAERDGLDIDIEALSKAIGIKVIPTVAVRRRGLDDVRTELGHLIGVAGKSHATAAKSAASISADFQIYQRQGRDLARQVTRDSGDGSHWARRVDAIALHPIIGPAFLAALMFIIFQGVFAWSEAPIGWIEEGIAGLQGLVSAYVPEGFIRSLLTEGIIGGVGSVVVFLPQILILFFFVLLLEYSGYMVRAAFLMDRMMAGVGLSGRAFIPLLSSFACAVPGIMATRTIEDPKDRLTTILIAPLMTCSARLPVYTLIIGAFIPERSVGMGVGLQGLVLFCLYIGGIVGAMVVAYILRQTVTKGSTNGFMMELPSYQLPSWKDVVLGLWTRAVIFLKRAGTIIMFSTIILWVLLSFPKPLADSQVSAVDYSIAGRIAGVIQPIVEPIGFNRDIALALVPAMAAREVAVSALATAYAIDAADENQMDIKLSDRLKGQWSLPTALAFLVWFIFAPQCISTIAIVKRETNGWKWTLFMVGYLFVLAYLAAGVTYWVAKSFGL